MSKANTQSPQPCIDVFQKVEKAIDLAIDIVKENKEAKEAELIEATIYESLVDLTEYVMLYSMPTGEKEVVQ